MSGGGSGALFRDGALFGPAVAAGDWWRLVTYGFLHAGLLHIGFNMLLLWLFGRELEPQLGTPRFLRHLLLLRCWRARSARCVFSPDALTVGASGAIFGLMGAAAAILYARGINPFQTDIGMLIVFNLVLSFVLSNVSVGGHIGGLVGGDRRRPGRRGRRAAPAALDRLGRARRRRDRLRHRRRDGRPQRRHRPRALGLDAARRAPAPARRGTARGCRMWASVSSPSTSRGPGRENVADASIATTRCGAERRAAASACASASSSERAAS